MVQVERDVVTIRDAMFDILAKLPELVIRLPDRRAAARAERDDCSYSQSPRISFGFVSVGEDTIVGGRGSGHTHRAEDDDAKQH